MRVATRSEHALLCHRLASLVLSGERLSLKELEEELGYEGDYLSRLFCSFTGERVGTFRKRVRLERSAHRLLNGGRLVDLAVEAGYCSVEAWMKAFKDAYRLPPSKFRAECLGYQLPAPNGIHWSPTEEPSLPCGCVGVLRDVSDISVATISVRGDYRDIPSRWRALAARLPERLVNSETKWITLFLDDGLRKSGRDSMRSELGFLLQDHSVPPEFNVRQVHGGVFVQTEELTGAEAHTHAWRQLNIGWVEKQVPNRDQPGFDLYDSIPTNWQSVRAIAALKVFRPSRAV